jgi:hypothetical protein
MDVCETNRSNSWKVTKNEEMDLVEGTASSDMEKEIAYGVRASNEGAPAAP